MLMNKQGEKMSIDGREYYVGMAVICNEVTAYAGLRGHILELRDGDDRESENETVDIVCELYTPDRADECREIEEKFSRLYGRAVTLDDIGLDYVIMAASMIEPADGANNLSGTNNDSEKANLPGEPRVSPFELTDGDKIIMAFVRLEYEANTSGGQNVPSIPIYNHLKRRIRISRGKTRDTFGVQIYPQFTIPHH